MRNRFIVILIFVSSNLFAQLNDNVWLFGYHYWPNTVPSMDFYFGYPNLIQWNSKIEFDYGADESICNSAGDLLFYSNGNVICNYQNDTLAGSLNFNHDSLVDSVYHGHVGVEKQNEVILPYPGHIDQYFIVHQCGSIWNSGQYGQPVQLKYSIVDMSTNSGIGSMLVKNQVLINDTLLFGTIQAVKHGNGRDWWIIVHKWQSNAFYVCLLTQNGIQSISLKNTSRYLSNGLLYYDGQIKFSLDGTKLALARTDSSFVDIYSFDRCNGDLLLIDSLDFSLNPQDHYLYGVSFSPSGQYLYITTGYNLFQYDLITHNQIPIKISTWDGSGSLNPYYLLRQYNGPDGKIYISMPPSNKLHIINNPNNADTLCNFTQHSLTLPSWQAGFLPEFPNFRLSALVGSGCDTLTNINESVKSDTNSLVVNPNPSNGIFKLKFNTINSNNAEINIYSLDGKNIYHDKLAIYSNQGEIDLSAFENNMYFVKITNGNLNYTKKIVIIK